MMILRPASRAMVLPCSIWSGLFPTNGQSDRRKPIYPESGVFHSDAIAGKVAKARRSAAFKRGVFGLNDRHFSLPIDRVDRLSSE
jgi:hypothetical protein